MWTAMLILSMVGLLVGVTLRGYLAGDHSHNIWAAHKLAWILCILMFGMFVISLVGLIIWMKPAP